MSILQKPIFFEYTQAATPTIKEILPMKIQNPHETITTPNLFAKYLTLEDPMTEQTLQYASSHVFYVLSGNGFTTIDNNFEIIWEEGDVFVLPYSQSSIFHKKNSSTATLFYANDEPLLRYLSAQPVEKRFTPVLYKKHLMMNKINEINQEDDALTRNRNGILLSNPQMEKENLNTLTHTMWSLLNFIGPNTIQKPHRHNSVAIDLCTHIDPDAENKGQVYTLMGRTLEDLEKAPVKMIWKKGCVFTTPPGWWHSHHNDSNKPAWVFPIQDAGLHTHLRTLDIQFYE